LNAISSALLDAIDLTKTTTTQIVGLSTTAVGQLADSRLPR